MNKSHSNDGLKSSFLRIIVNRIIDLYCKASLNLSIQQLKKARLLWKYDSDKVRSLGKYLKGKY